MDCGCIVMLVSVGIGLVLIIFGGGHLIYPNSDAERQLAIMFVLIGIALVIAPFVWLNWASEQSLKRRHDPSRKKSFWEG